VLFIFYHEFQVYGNVPSVAVTCLEGLTAVTNKFETFPGNLKKEVSIIIHSLFFFVKSISVNWPDTNTQVSVERQNYDHTQYPYLHHIKLP